MRASHEILDQFLNELIETEKGPRKVLKIPSCPKTRSPGSEAKSGPSAEDPPASPRPVPLPGGPFDSGRRSA